MSEPKEKQSQAPGVVTSADFFGLKSEVREIMHQIQSMQTALLLKLSTVIVVAVAASFGAFVYINDLRMELMNEHHQARFEKLEAAVFSPASEVLLNEIRKLREDYKTLIPPTTGGKPIPATTQSPQAPVRKTKR